MNAQDERVVDDWLAAKKSIVVALKIDNYLQGELDAFMRESVPDGKRRQWAARLIEVAEDKQSPGGWIATCLKNGTLEKALVAAGAAMGRRERREEKGIGRGRYECRQALRIAYEQRNGEVRRGTKKCDDEGGMPWAVIAEDDPELAKIIRMQMHRLMFHDSWERDGYSFVPSNTVYYLTVAAEEVAAGLHRQYADMARLGILLPEHDSAPADWKPSGRGATVEAIEL